MLQRHEDWFSFFGISQKDTDRAKNLTDTAIGPSAGMMSHGDFYALAAALLHHKPTVIFEIGTYMGVSSNFFLSLLPKTQVISIAFIPASQLSPDMASADSNAAYNNDDLSLDQVGSLVSNENRPRFTQLIGDSHTIVARDFVTRHGKMDFVFIDGDHSRDGVAQDTVLAMNLIGPKGAIGWHDANPKRRYIGSQLFLEQDLEVTALATADNYIGGVAFWTEKLEKRLLSKAAA
jgi:predicted O-methyltransferase YrrM